MSGASASERWLSPVVAATGSRSIIRLPDATIDDLERYPWPDPSAPGRGEGAEMEARRLYEDTDLALVGRFGGPIVETAIYLMGFEEWLIRILKDPEFVEVLLDKITDISMALDRIGLEATAKYLQILKISGDDFGMQTGPLYRPRPFAACSCPVCDGAGRQPGHTWMR